MLKSVRSIIVATDFSPRSHGVFEHALALATVFRAHLGILHVGGDGGQQWSRFPHVRDTLSRWGLLEPAAGREAVFERHGVRVRKINTRGAPADAIGSYLADHPASLFVAGTGARHGLGKLLHPSVAARVAREARIPSLFLPDHANGLVASADGSVDLARIVVPVDHVPSPILALTIARESAAVFGDGTVDITCVHAGASENPPALDLSGDASCAVRLECVSGAAVDVITTAADDADLIVMTTAGRCGVLEGVVGSTAERIVERAPCAVLTVPAGDVGSR